MKQALAIVLSLLTSLQAHEPTTNRPEPGEVDCWECWGYLNRVEFFKHPEYGIPFPGVQGGKMGIFIPHPDYKWRQPEPQKRPLFYFMELSKEPAAEAGRELDEDSRPFKTVTMTYNYWVNFPGGDPAKHGINVAYNPEKFAEDGLFRHTWYDADDNLIFPGAPTLEVKKAEWNAEMRDSMMKSISAMWKQFEEKERRKIQFTKKVQKEPLAVPNPGAVPKQQSAVVTRFKDIIKACRALLDEAEQKQMDAMLVSLESK